MTKFEMQKGNVERLWSAFNLVDQDDELGELGFNIDPWGIVVTITSAALVAYTSAKAYERTGSMNRAMVWGVGASAFPIPMALASWFIGR